MSVTVVVHPHLNTASPRSTSMPVVDTTCPRNTTSGSHTHTYKALDIDGILLKFAKLFARVRHSLA